MGGSKTEVIAMATKREVPRVEDPLADALTGLHVTGMFYCPSILTAPWGIELPEMIDHLWFHVVTSGECQFVTPGGQTIAATTGDVLVFAHGGRHHAVSEPGTHTPSVFDLPHEYSTERYATMTHGGEGGAGGGDLTTLTCGVVTLEHRTASRLLASIPEVIRLRARTDEPWFDSLLELIASETRSMRPGAEVVVSRLCDILVIHAIRTWATEEPAATAGWVGALRDPHVGAAIAAIHQWPGEDWTVESLATQANMSRSALSARFRELLDQSPAQYVAQWRMEIAADRLRHSPDPIFDIATDLGYGSEAAFSRAFKRVMGTPPSELRPR